MNTVELKAAFSTKDNNPSNSRMFNDSANRLWRDNLPFNLFTAEGYLTEEAIQYIRDNREVLEPFKKDSTWADAILEYAEFRELGYQCDKAPKKRSDVKFSGSMILSAYIDLQEEGNTYKTPNNDGEFDAGIDLIEELTLESYK